MLQRIILVSCALLMTPALALAAQTAQAAHQKIVNAVSSEAKAQAMYTRWSDTKQETAAQIRDMKAMDSWLDFQNHKYAKYIEKQESVIAELKRRKEEAKRIRMQLEPFLEKVVDNLEQFVNEDLPFLREERQQRIVFLRTSLNDYRLELSEKLRRVFEALQVETEYGRTVASDTVEMDLNGTPTRVNMFRLGRTALFYRAADGSSAGVWDRDAGSWKTLGAEYARTLHRAVDMAQRKRAVELLDLPVGVAQ